MDDAGKKVDDPSNIFTMSEVNDLEKSDAAKGKKVTKSLTRREMLIIASLAYSNFCQGTIYSLLAPFFPNEVSPVTIGQPSFLSIGILKRLGVTCRPNKKESVPQSTASSLASTSSECSSHLPLSASW